MKKLYTAFAFLGLLFATPVLAHVKWFVDSEAVSDVLHGLVPFYAITSNEVIIWTIIAVIGVYVCKKFDDMIKVPKKLEAYAHKHEKMIIRIAQAIFGLFLVTVTLLWNIILVPEFPIENMFTSALGYIQILAGLLYIANYKPHYASYLILLLYIVLGLTHGLMPLFENLILISLALYFAIKSGHTHPTLKHLEPRALEIVRIATGVSLIVLAFTEKLMYPELSMIFLNNHQWNFMHAIFPWFTDTLFILSTGFAECIFGIIFILGYNTRINTLIIAGFFSVSVVSMAIGSHAWEVEDLVVYSAAILFLFFGNGGLHLVRKLKLTKAQA